MEDTNQTSSSIITITEKETIIQGRWLNYSKLKYFKNDDENKI